MYQAELNNPELDSIFQSAKSNDSVPIATVQKEKGKCRNGGRISILQIFPDIPHIATEFIKASGFKAQEKRRESTITSCGVSLRDIREHLIKEIPGLRKHGISETSARYLFNPVNKRKFTEARYKSMIDAAVPCKDNSPRKENLDVHYLLSRIKLWREMAAYFSDEITIVSADSMNKILDGTLAVSRYHQIRKIFMSSDKPKYLDHGFLLPYKTIPDGIMILSNNKDDDLFLHDDVVIDETVRYNTLQELQEKVITIENKTDRINNALYRAAYTLKAEADVFGIISRRLSAIGFPNLTKEKLDRRRNKSKTR